MKIIKQLAIIGATASGKTALSINLAKQLNANILSLDSLSIYKEIDIVSAKPSFKERDGVPHFGIDHLYPNEAFDVKTYINLYKSVYEQSQREDKNLVIVGGSSFYLKMLIEGVSPIPTISKPIKEKTKSYLNNLDKSYKLLYDEDKRYMSQIKPNDKYRIEKALLIYLETGITPSEYFRLNPPKPAISEELPIYQIDTPRDILRERIAQRTKIMIKDGLIDEVCDLEYKYTREPNAMKSIGIKETLDYLNGLYNRDMLIEKITTHTARLAKRQNTFNNSQFEGVIKNNLEKLSGILLNSY
ncbi:MAG: tRNA (adenosine(37)-N6)-dimethylallyltransferase MiaA [Sulfurovum sp.]